MRPQLLLRLARIPRPAPLVRCPPSRLFTSTIPRRNDLPAATPLPNTPPPTPAGAAPPRVPIEKPFYITTPIFYVNADPHVGHLYTMILTDVIKRWQELKGRRALMCTGTDEHGMKIQQAAAAAEKEPLEFCNAGAETFKKLAAESNTSYTTFMRTTDPAHREAVQYFWQLLEARGYIYAGKHEGWYSVSDETFYPITQTQKSICPATGNPIRVSTETGRQVTWFSETNYHFRLSSLAPQLLAFYEQNPDFLLPASRHAEIVAEVSAGLTDLSISRPIDRLSWGIPVPSDAGQTIYVWLDALTNYLTAAGFPFTPGRSQELGWPADLHVIGKDITKFHCIYFPAFLLALDLPLPRQILAHAHWTLGHKKMSKTEGNVVNPFFALKRFGVDAMRYYMARDGGIQNDADYSNEYIIERYKKALQSGFGNLANRVCGKAFDISSGVAASRAGLDGAWDLDEHDQLLISTLRDTAAAVDLKMQVYDVPNAVKTIEELMVQANRYITNVEPWYLKKPEEKALQCKRIYLGAEAVRISAILLQPFMPERAKGLLDQMGVSEERRGFEWSEFAADDAFGKGSNDQKWTPFPPLSE